MIDLLIVRTNNHYMCQIIEQGTTCIPLKEHIQCRIIMQTEDENNNRADNNKQCIVIIDNYIL